MADSAKARKIAMNACKAIATSSHDPDTAETLGIRHFHVLGKTGDATLVERLA